MSKQDVINYVLNSPYNTNPAVLRSMMSNLGGGEPVILYSNSADYYLEDPTMGDLVLAAIQNGQSILVRVPNSDDGIFTAIYAPILMYQIPNYENDFLYLFYLKDEKQDLSAIAPGMQMPTYGQLKMKLSKKYNISPLEKEKVPLVERAVTTLIFAEMATYGYTIEYSLANFYGDRTYLVITEYNGSQTSHICTLSEFGDLRNQSEHLTINNKGEISAMGFSIDRISIYEIIDN